MDDLNKTTAEPMRCVRRAKGELEEGRPAGAGEECCLCNQMLPLGVITHHDDDVGGYVCSDCGPELQMAELFLLGTPPTLRSVGSLIRRPDPEEIEGLLAWDR